LPGIVAGVLVGAAAASRWRVGPLPSLLLGLLTAFLATRVRDTLEARVREALSDEPFGAALSLAFDMAVGAGGGLAAAPLLGASVLPVVGAGAGLAGLWSFLVGRVLGGTAVDRAVDFLLAGDQSADFAHEPIVADATALEHAGQVEGALRKYREVIAQRPRQPDAYLRAAALLQRAGRAAEAAELLRQARRRARLTDAHELAIGRQLVELTTGPLADPTAALAELTLLAEHFRGTPEGESAARQAEALRASKPD
jgi:tetratricopeptide (TPR) repeat protein